MSPGNRQQLLNQRKRGVYHCSNRCVRRAFLCGEDPVTGRDFSHRRDWIQTREQQLAALFAIEVGFHAEMSNHMHLVLRTRPDIAKGWSREEVARRWLTLTRLAKCMSDAIPEPQEMKLEELLKNKKELRKARRRLSCVSWFMAILSENIARRANAEDECKGKFWESRYKCRELTDHHSILLCGIYVDLNPIKAGEARLPETARYTSAYQRIRGLRQRRNARDRTDGWLSELTWRDDVAADETMSLSSRTGRRASDLGLLPISVENYLKLLRWTARQIHSKQRSTVPKDLESVLDHLNVNAECWVAGVGSYETEFCEIVGSRTDLAKAAGQMGRRHLKGVSTADRIFK